ncbi:hypothetical protein M9H77_16072 [Catharanthus roseus]|uniref:Uncharacterized protein n=1 Tax=Catharanthus roseus TaxID=4058 RepID=A0ACC0AZA4_CATRO|nr:hypothetical protein M9H77_16072 [Catharanthus roseus]
MDADFVLFLAGTMDAALMAQFQSFSLRGSEKLSIKVVEDNFKTRMEEYGLCCVGRFNWAKNMNVRAYHPVICQVWGCLDLSIVKLQDRVHHLFFPDEGSNKKALERGLFLVIKIDKEGNKFFQFRSDVLTKHLLRRVFVLETPSNSEIVGLVQYEQLPHLCFCYGHWDHILLDCPILPSSASR